MIYQPRNVKPSASPIDALKNNVFSMEMQTNSAVTAYSIWIANFENELAYYIPKTTLSNSLYNGDILEIPIGNYGFLTNGENYKWGVRLYQDNADALVSYGNITGRDVSEDSSGNPLYWYGVNFNINIEEEMYLSVGGELRKIEIWDEYESWVALSTDFSTPASVGDKYYIYSSFIKSSPEYIFYAREEPAVEITNIVDTISRKYYTFRGEYSQDEGVAMTYHIFNLYLKNSDGSKTLIDTSGKVYSANLSYKYDSFKTGNTYVIQMIVENDMGVISSTEEYEFDVSYQIIEYLQQPTAVFNPKQNSINISWAAPVENEAVFTNLDGTNRVSANILNDIPYPTTNSLYTDGYKAKWDTEEGLCVLPEDYVISFQFSPDENFFFSSDNEYMEEKNIITGETDEGETFSISINKTNLVFDKEDGTTITESFYSGRTILLDFVNTSDVIPLENKDYVWLDSGTWRDEKYWTEGGTSLERVCNHWWKVQIKDDEIKIEEIYPSS